MVKKMIIVVGEKVLLEALKKLHYCVSLQLHAFSCFMSNPRRIPFKACVGSSPCKLYRKDFTTCFGSQFHCNNLLKGLCIKCGLHVEHKIHSVIIW
jgi:hypothetical protein